MFLGVNNTKFMNIAFIFLFFSYKTVRYDLSILLKKNPVNVYFMREIFEDESKTLKNFFFQIQKIDLMCMLCSQLENIKVTQA